MAEEETTDMVPVKLRPGYTFKHPDSGVALQRSLPDKKTGESTVEAIGKDGGRETMPGPFFLLSEKAIKGQWCKFERPTEEEEKMLKGAIIIVCQYTKLITKEIRKSRRLHLVP